MRSSNINPEKTVWVGEVKEGTTYQELLLLGQQHGDASWAEVWKTTAAVGFKTPEAARTAAVSMNGTVFSGKALKTDMWGKKDGGSLAPSTGKGKGKGKSGGYPTRVAPRMSMFDKTQGYHGMQYGKGSKGGKGGQWIWMDYGASWYSKGKGKGKGKQRRSNIGDPSKCVWIGGLPQGCLYQDVLEVAKTVGSPKWAEVFGTTAAIGYASEEEVQTAIPALTGMTVKGETIEADLWSKDRKA